MDEFYAVNSSAITCNDKTLFMCRFFTHARFVMSTTVTRYFLSGKLKLCHHQIVLYGTSAASSKNDIYVVNLRSDTFTLPTSSMKKAMVEAHLGDDVYGEDPTVNSNNYNDHLSVTV